MASTDPAVVLDNLVKRYPGPRGTVTAVAGIDLQIAEGEVFGLLGPNGAGKTTTIESLVGLLAPSEGTVRVMGMDPSKERPKIRHTVAVQPQHAAVFEHQTVAELLRAWASFYPDAAGVDEIIARMGLTESRDVRTAKLSGGQRQRLLVGTALLSRPRLLVLDEPSTGMDPNAREDLWSAIRDHRDSGNTVLLSTHSMEEAETLCDRVAVVDRGEVVACGSPSELVQRHAPEQELLFTVAAGSDLREIKERTDVSEVSLQEAADATVRVRVRTADPDSVLIDVLTGDLGARRIQTEEAGLEEVFRRVTGRSFAGADAEETP